MKIPGTITPEFLPEAHRLVNLQTHRLSPGRLITIYGANLSDSTAQAQNLPLPRNWRYSSSDGRPASAAALHQHRPDNCTRAVHGPDKHTIPDLGTDGERAVGAGGVGGAGWPAMDLHHEPAGTGQGEIVKSDQITLAQLGAPANIGDGGNLLYRLGCGDTYRSQPEPEHLPRCLRLPTIRLP